MLDVSACGHCGGRGWLEAKADDGRALRCPHCRRVTDGRPYSRCWEPSPPTSEACGRCGHLSDEIWIDSRTGLGLCRSCAVE